MEENYLKKTFKAACIQFETEDGNFEKNYNRFLSLFNLTENAKLIVLPELFLTGFCYDKLKEAAVFSEKVVSHIMEFSKGLSTVLIYTVIEKINNSFFNSVHVVENGKLLLSRPKVKLFSPMEEDKYFKPGRIEDLKTAKTSIGTIAPIVCFELRFFEVFYKLLKQEAEIFTVSAQWGKARRKHWEILTAARAIETQRFVVAANGSGKMAGCSAIIDPWGRILAKAYDGNSTIFAQIELSKIKQVEKKLPLKINLVT